MIALVNNHKIDPGCATIIGAVIGAIALVVGTAIGAVLVTKSQPIQVFLGMETPTAIAQSNVLDLPFSQPTYTPYPTFTPPRTIMAPKPITVIPTASADQQNPLPGSTILAGQGFTKNGVTISLRKSSFFAFNMKNEFGFRLTIDNQSDQQILVLWRESFVHLRDDKGKIYHRNHEDRSDWDNKNKQFTIARGGTFEMASMHYANIGEDTLPGFSGGIDPTSKYLIFTIDQMLGMSDMNWRYDLQ